MRVEIISIGDELLLGQTVNTNASWIGEKLLNIGIQVEWITTVGDTYQNLRQALQIAEKRADSIIVTGGLGPTHDDITKPVVVDYFSSNLVMNQEILTTIRERFAKRGYDMAKVNEDQARVPDNAKLVENKLGTAPGMIFQKSNKTFYILPGVPREMKGMMNRVVIPDLQSRKGRETIKIKTLMTTGVPESILFEKLDNLSDIEKQARVAFLPSLMGVKIRLTARGGDEKIAENRLERAEKLVRQKINREIYADKVVSLEETIAQLLSSRDETVAVAESCTGGLISNQLTNIPGSSTFFERGIVAYSNEAKMTLLGVDPQLLNRHGAVSEPVARAMAVGVRNLAKTTYGISVTGIAGPGGGTAEKPVGLVYVGFADVEKTLCEKHTFANDRIGNKMRSLQAALNLLRKQIEQQ